MTGYPPQSGTPADQAEIAQLRAELRRALDVQIRVNIQRGEARAEVERLRGLLAEALNGWEDHDALVVGEYGGEPEYRIDEIRREAGIE